MRVLLVEDHGLLADSVAAVFRANGHDVYCTTSLEFADIEWDADRFRPDVVLLDLQLGAHDSTPLIEPLTDLGARVVMVTGVTDRLRLAACVEAGAVGLVDKSKPIEDLLESVRTVSIDGTLLHRGERDDLLAELRDARAAQEEALQPFGQLTAREREVLTAMIAGHSAEKMSRDAYVSIATVRSQIRSVLAKLGVHSQLGAVALARTVGWEHDACR